MNINENTIPEPAGCTPHSKPTIKPVNLNHQAILGMGSHNPKNSKLSLLEL